MSYPPPRYHDEHGSAMAHVRPAGQGPDLRNGGGGAVHYLATSTSTAGEYGLFRWEMGPQPSGPSAHFHRTISEAFYVLEGSVRLYDGRDWREGTPGDFLYVPPGGIHAFRNESGAPAAMLMLFAPGADREQYFEELARIAASGDDLSPQEWTALYARHDQYMV